MGQNRHTLIRGQQEIYLRWLLKKFEIPNTNGFIGIALIEYRDDMKNKKVIEGVV